MNPGKVIKGTRRERDQERNQRGQNPSSTAWTTCRSGQRPPVEAAGVLPLPPGRNYQSGLVDFTFSLLTTKPHQRGRTMVSTAQRVTSQTVMATASNRDSFPRRALRSTPRGASSHFVGTSIMILSSFALSTLAMNFGKKIQASRHKPNEI